MAMKSLSSNLEHPGLYANTKILLSIMYLIGDESKIIKLFDYILLDYNKLTN